MASPPCSFSPICLSPRWVIHHVDHQRLCRVPARCPPSPQQGEQEEGEAERGIYQESGTYGTTLVGQRAQAGSGPTHRGPSEAEEEAPLCWNPFCSSSPEDGRPTGQAKERAYWGGGRSGGG